MLKNKKTAIPFIILFVLAAVFAVLWYLNGSGKVIIQNSNSAAPDINNNLVNTGTISRGEVTENSNSGTKSFENSDYHFKLALEEGETVKETSSAEIYTVNFNNGHVSVLNANMESSIESSVSSASREGVDINGVSGIRITGSSLKDGSETSFITVLKNGKLYYFQGSDAFLTRIINNFSFSAL